MPGLILNSKIDECPVIGTAALAAVTEQCQRILTSPEMRRSAQLQALLLYIVEQTLAGRRAALTARSIGIAAMGKGESFDASGDPSVRVAAIRLRRVLEYYYLVHGRSDPVLIELPKGAYVAWFGWRTNVDTAPDKGGGLRPMRRQHAWRLRLAGLALGMAVVFGTIMAVVLLRTPQHADATAISLPALHLANFAALNDDPRARSHAAVIGDELSDLLFRPAELTVFLSHGFQPQSFSTPTVARRGRAFTLVGNVSVRGSILLVYCRLLATDTMAVLWAQSFSADLMEAAPISIDDNIAASIADAVSHKLGLMASRGQRREKPPGTTSFINGKAIRPRISAG